MNEKITIAVIAGTTREGRESIKAANWVAEEGRKREDAEIIFVDPKDFNLPNDGDNEDTRDPRYSEITAKADAFYIVTPEYNRSIPGSLKRLIDSEFDNYHHKAVATAGVSSGQWGGTRVCEALLHVYHTLWLVVIKPELYFPKVKELFDDQGNMNPEYIEAYQKNVHVAYDELVWMARVLKAAKTG